MAQQQQIQRWAESNGARFLKTLLDIADDNEFEQAFAQMYTLPLNNNLFREVDLWIATRWITTEVEIIVAQKEYHRMVLDWTHYENNGTLPIGENREMLMEELGRTRQALLNARARLSEVRPDRPEDERAMIQAAATDSDARVMEGWRMQEPLLKAAMKRRDLLRDSKESRWMAAGTLDFLRRKGWLALSE
ncbi:hypothetical protein NA57DRAFT_70593 [Rhizodiscina lignyota]|uniref:Uncharacterized protein n=1 Tax=Rhizodiscina lignyota TaxID=1504668 RepID=A0A9P4IU90_9PEZI|nr:hypothetical protein NA57DRAFT_70593 [Rhizodiscina lignyota]